MGWTGVGFLLMIRSFFVGRVLVYLTCMQVSSQMEKKTKVTIKRKTYFDEQDSDDNDDDLM